MHQSAFIPYSSRYAVEFPGEHMYGHMFPQSGGGSHVEPFRVIFCHESYLPAESRRIADTSERSFLYAMAVHRDVVTGSQCQPVVSGYLETFGQYAIYGGKVIGTGVFKGVIGTYYYCRKIPSFFQWAYACLHGTVLLEVTLLPVIPCRFQQRAPVTQFQDR